MKKKIIIIGAGISGLSAGIYAQKNGYESIIFEKTHFAGGNLTGWKRKDCYIDNCIHWLNGSKSGNQLNKLWNELGAFENLQFYQSEDFVVSEYNGQKIGLNKDVEVTRKNMINLSPNDQAEIDKFIDSVKIITELDNQTLFGKINSLLKVFSYYKRQTLGDVANKFKHPLLQKLLTDYIIKEYSVYTLLFAYSSFSSGDGKVIKNGSLAMAKNIEKTYLSLGGQIKYNSKVVSFIFKEKTVVGITLENGQNVYADKIICCIDPKIVYDKMLPKSCMPRGLENSYNQRKSYPIISSFHIAYKINTTLEISDTFVFELQKPIKIGSTIYERIMLRSYAYGIDFTPDNSFVMQVFLLQQDKDYDVWANLSESAYSAEKQRITNRLTQEIVTRFPKIKDKIEFLDCWTPLSYTKYFDAYKGSYMSFGITNKIRPSTFPHKCKQFKNLYFASQWQRLFGGLPNALSSGKNCIDKVVKEDNKVKFSIKEKFLTKKEVSS